MRWKLASCALLVCALSGGVARADAPRGEVVEQVVAVVRGPGTPQPRVITLTRLEEEARIALVSRGAVSAALAPLDADTLRATLEWLIDQTLLGDEVSRLQVFDVTPRQLEVELERFRDRFARPADYKAFLARLDLDEEDLGAVLRRTLRVAQYVQSRVTGTSTGEGTEQERVVRAVKALVTDLRDRSEVRLVGELDGRGT